MSADDKLLSTLGLCAKAGRLVIGTPMVCERLRCKGAADRVLAVLEANDTSDNTHAKITSKCSFYSVPHYRINADAERLAHVIGKTGAVAAVGVLDTELYRALLKYLPDSTFADGKKM